MRIFQPIGQAVVEYLIVFTFMALIAINVMAGIGVTVGETMGSLAFHLSQELSVGVCPSLCFYDNYENQQSGSASP